MNIWLVVTALVAVLLIVGGIMLIKQSAKKFKLTEEQLEQIKERNRQLEKEEDQER